MPTPRRSTCRACSLRQTAHVILQSCLECSNPTMNLADLLARQLTGVLDQALLEGLNLSHLLSGELPALCSRGLNRIHLTSVCSLARSCVVLVAADLAVAPHEGVELLPEPSNFTGLRG